MKLSEVTFSGANLIRLARTNAAGRISVKDFDLSGSAPGKAPQALKDFVHKSSMHVSPVTLNLPRNQVSVKYVTLPSVQSQEVKNMVEYEIADIFPYKSEELVYDHALVNGASDGYSRVMLVAAPRDVVKNACRVVEDAGLVPGVVSVSTLSLYERFVKSRTLPAHYLLICVENTLVEIMFISGDKLEFTRALKIDPSRDTVAQVLSGIETTVMVLTDLGNRIDVAVLCGSCAVLDEIGTRIKETLEFTVEIDTALVSLDPNASGEAPRLSINLLPPEMHTQQKNKARKKELFYLSILVCVNLVFLVNVLYVRMKVKREYLNWLRAEISRVEQPATDLRKKASSMQLLNKYRLSGKRTLALLSEIYRIAPAGISLNALDISHRKTGGAMTLSGGAQDPDSVLKFSEALKKSRLVTGADVHYIKKQRAPGQDQEQRVDFELIASFDS